MPNNSTLMVADGVVVSLDYILRLDDGEIFDASDGSPLEYLHGYAQIVPGLEKELTGLAIGDEKDVVVAAAEAYGDIDEEAFQTVDRDVFPDEVELELGMPLRMRDAQTGEPFDAVIVELGENGVLLDFNHPLAGEELHFRIKIVDLRNATSEELEHGHAHGIDDHD
jgi:FKBP-type peptidyl-prolyl cis-trans isomerase SlyD